MSPVEHYSIHSPEMQFKRGPTLGPPRAGSMTQHVVTIQREYTSDYDTETPSSAFMKTSDEEKNLLQ